MAPGCILSGKGHVHPSYRVLSRYSGAVHCPAARAMDGPYGNTLASIDVWASGSPPGKEHGVLVGLSKELEASSE
jgi:hypothetical protein